MRALRLAAVVAIAAAIVPAAARADADPPSDFLLSQSLYVPYFGGQASKESTTYLKDVVRAANASGYQIKVAVIGSRQDLGGVFSLYGKPTRYAPFLGREVAFAYKGPLLTSMPAGFGVYWYKHDTSRERRIVDGVRIEPGLDGLVDSTAAAVKRLAAANGHTIDVEKSGGGSGGGGGSGIGLWLILAVAGALVLAALVLLPLLLRRRRAAA